MWHKSNNHHNIILFTNPHKLFTKNNHNQKQEITIKEKCLSKKIPENL